MYKTRQIKTTVESTDKINAIERGKNPVSCSGENIIEVKIPCVSSSLRAMDIYNNNMTKTEVPGTRVYIHAYIHTYIHI
jgi:hypothetical protein